MGDMGGIQGGGRGGRIRRQSGMKGDKGERGAEGRKGIPGDTGEDGQKGDRGPVGPADVAGGGMYIHWGRHSCPFGNGILKLSTLVELEGATVLLTTCVSHKTQNIQLITYQVTIMPMELSSRNTLLNCCIVMFHVLSATYPHDQPS